jgi:hypothetical protein
MLNDLHNQLATINDESKVDLVEESEKKLEELKLALRLRPIRFEFSVLRIFWPRASINF